MDPEQSLGRSVVLKSCRPREISSMREHRERLQDITKGSPGLQDSYWRFGTPGKPTKEGVKYFLCKNAFYYKETESLARLKKLAESCDRGHPSYEAFNVAELRQFADDRNRNETTTRKVSKKELVLQLENADDVNDAINDSREFTRFFELPPELRNSVYIFYYQSLSKVPQRFSQPPLCTASRQLRKESMSLFYEHSTFSISMICQRLLTVADVSMNPQTGLFRDSISTSHLARIKHFCVELDLGSYKNAACVWTIDLTNGQCTVDFGRLRKQHMQRLVDLIVARERHDVKLTKGDFFEGFRVAVDRELYEIRRSLTAGTLFAF